MNPETRKFSAAIAAYGDALAQYDIEIAVALSEGPQRALEPARGIVISPLSGLTGKTNWA